MQSKTTPKGATTLQQKYCQANFFSGEATNSTFGAQIVDFLRFLVIQITPNWLRSELGRALLSHSELLPIRTPVCL